MGSYQMLCPILQQGTNFGLVFEESISYDKPFSKVISMLQQSFPICLKLDRLATPPNKTALQH